MKVLQFNLNNNPDVIKKLVLLKKAASTAGSGWCFPGKNPFLDRFCVSKRDFPMRTHKIFLKEKSKKHVMCFSDVSYR